jgi:hypothetical protein
VAGRPTKRRTSVNGATPKIEPQQNDKLLLFRFVTHADKLSYDGHHESAIEKCDKTSGLRLKRS